MKRSSLIMLLLLAVAGCSVLPDFDDVLPDKRTEYKKSQSMPDLEVPPDLTANAINESMAIPNEEATTLSRYRRQQQPGAAIPAVSVVAGDQHSITVAAGPADIWPVLRQWFTANGYSIELDDAELGVLETGWSQPVSEGGLVKRSKFKIFSEPGAAPGTTLLVISGTRQEQTPGGDGSWLDGPPDQAAETRLAGELNLHLNRTFGGTAAAGGAAPVAVAGAGSSTIADRARAEILNDQEGRIYLAIPEEFTGAWRVTEAALQRAGVTIDGKDPAKGLYRVTFFPAPEEQEKGWLSKLAFWKGDESEGRPYGISLTGQGEKTELIVLNEEGDWETNQDAGRLLGLIQNAYNSR